MKTTLIIMAAGIGSRFGGGIKQLASVGPAGEILMEYSIRDALAAGFDNILFIIRRDLEKEFKEVIGQRMEKICPVSYVYQEVEDLPPGFPPRKGRSKPWGTGQALLACKALITDPFVVINADDYYGKVAFQKVHDYLLDATQDKDAFGLCLAGFILKNTLSAHGGVTRGVVEVDGDLHLTRVTETRSIMKDGQGAAVLLADGGMRRIDENAYVSMNMWGATPALLPVLETGFVDFLNRLSPEDEDSEYLLPTIIDGLIQSGIAKVKLLETREQWFGVTYKEDRKTVSEAMKALDGGRSPRSQAESPGAETPGKQ